MAIEWKSMETFHRVHFFLSLALMLALCATGISLNILMADIRKLSLQVAENKTEILKLHVDLLKATAVTGTVKP